MAAGREACDHRRPGSMTDYARNLRVMRQGDRSRPQFSGSCVRVTDHARNLADHAAV